jgi:hypothetical protein
MNFDLVKNVKTEDENGDVVETTVTIGHRAVLDNGVLEVFMILEDGTETRLIHQPWKFVAGVRTNWDNIEEGVAWFKAENDHVGE